jgi:hypothetical protein
LPGILGEPFLDAAAVFEGVSNSLRDASPPLGRLTSQYIRLFGGWIGLVLEWLTAWIAAGLGLWLFARWMGGQGSLRQHMSLFLLAVIPQVFTLGSEFAGESYGLVSMLSVISLIAWVWSLVMIVYNLVIAHELPLERAMLAMLFFLSFSLIIVPMMLLSLLGVLIGALV